MRKKKELFPTEPEEINNVLTNIFTNLGSTDYKTSLGAATDFNRLYNKYAKTKLDKLSHEFIYWIIQDEIKEKPLAESIKTGLFSAYLELKDFWKKRWSKEFAVGMTYAYWDFLKDHFFKIFSFWGHKWEESGFGTEKPLLFPFRNRFANWFFVWVVMDKNVKENIMHNGDYHLFFRESDNFEFQVKNRILFRKYNEEKFKHRVLGRKDIKVTPELIEEAKNRMESNLYKSVSSIMIEVCLNSGLSKQTMIKWWSTWYKSIIPTRIKKKYGWDKGWPKYSTPVFKALSIKELKECYEEYLIIRGIYIQ